MLEFFCCCWFLFSLNWIKRSIWKMMIEYLIFFLSLSFSLLCKSGEVKNMYGKSIDLIFSFWSFENFLIVQKHKCERSESKFNCCGMELLDWQLLLQHQKISNRSSSGKKITKYINLKYTHTHIIIFQIFISIYFSTCFTFALSFPILFFYFP